MPVGRGATRVGARHAIPHQERQDRVNASISFLLDDDPAGFRPTSGPLADGGADVPACALMPGDTVSFPNHRNRIYRVVARHCNVDSDLDEPSWQIRLEPVRPAR